MLTVDTHVQQPTPVKQYPMTIKKTMLHNQKEQLDKTACAYCTCGCHRLSVRQEKVVQNKPIYTGHVSLHKSLKKHSRAPTTSQQFRQNASHAFEKGSNACNSAKTGASFASSHMRCITRRHHSLLSLLPLSFMSITSFRQALLLLRGLVYPVPQIPHVGILVYFANRHWRWLRRIKAVKV